MKISFFDVVVCYIMRYKITIIGVVASIICMIFTSKNSIVFGLIGLAALLFNIWYNGIILLDWKFNKSGILKKLLYNKYKEILGFKCALIYDENSLEYRYIDFDNTHYYTCNIYLFVIKTYQKEKILDYETKHSNTVIFIASSKGEIAEHFYNFVMSKVRKTYDDIRMAKEKNEKYSELAREVEYHRYSK